MFCEFYVCLRIKHCCYLCIIFCFENNFLLGTFTLLLFFLFFFQGCTSSVFCLLSMQFDKGTIYESIVLWKVTLPYIIHIQWKFKPQQYKFPYTWDKYLLSSMFIFTWTMWELRHCIVTKASIYLVCSNINKWCNYLKCSYHFLVEV